MKFPWVSRERLEDAEKRLTAVDAERLRLLDLLLGGAGVNADPPASRKDDKQKEKAARDEEYGDDGIRPVTEATAEAASFTTPFDRVLTRFDASHRGGKIPAQFKARLN